MSKLNSKRFLELVERCKLVEVNQLMRVMSSVRKSATPQQLDDAEYVGARLVDANLLTRWQCDKLLDGRHRGFFLGKYKLLGHLGAGGMSTVYLAEHVLMQRRVAIKVLPQARVQDASYLARFHLEARAAAALDHTNIVRAYDLDHDDKIHYLVMEHIDGRDIQRIVEQDGPLDYVLAAGMIAQAAAGLEHAHEAGLVHRDIKPANLLVDRKGAVKILDLGLAKFSKSEMSLTLIHDENVLGTADYLAPEQAVNSHTVDSRADIYSLGCTMYFMLTGRPPFPEGSLTERLAKHQSAEPASITLSRPDAPRELVEVCLRMMRKNADERYATAREVQQVLDAWLDAEGASRSGSGVLRRAVALAQASSGSGAGRGASVTPGSGVGSVGQGSGVRPVRLPPRREPSKPWAEDTSSDIHRDTLAVPPQKTGSGSGTAKGAKPPPPPTKDRRKVGESGRLPAAVTGVPQAAQAAPAAPVVAMAAPRADSRLVRRRAAEVEKKIRWIRWATIAAIGCVALIAIALVAIAMRQ